MFCIWREFPVTWASAFVANWPKIKLLIIAVNYGMSSTPYLLLDNFANLLKHLPQRVSRLLCFRTLVM